MILLGSSSLNSTQAQRPGPKGYAHRWELKSVTPGCIAMAAVVVSYFTYPLSPSPRLTILAQAQFIISPDRLFAEKGAISKIDYHSRFKQYKRIIIKNIDSPQMKALVARLNTQLFQIHSKDHQAISSAGEQGESEDEDAFSRAFQEQVTIGMLSIIRSHSCCTLIFYQGESTVDVPIIPAINLPSTSISVPTQGQSLIPPSHIPAPSPPANPSEPLTIPEDEDEAAAIPKKRSSKRNAKDAKNSTKRTAKS